MSRHKVIRTAFLVLAAVSVSMAQPDAARWDRPARAANAGAEGMLDPESLRARIEQSITRNESMLDRQREALRRLDAGESPAEIMRSLRVRDDSILRPRRVEGPPGAEPPMSPPDAEVMRPERADAGPGAGAGADAGPDAGPESDRQARITPEQRARLRVLLEQRLPSVHQQLAMVENDHPEIGQRLFDRLAPQLREIQRDMDRDPRLGELRLDEMRAGLAIVDASRAYWSSEAEVREQAGQSLREAIGQRFDARMALRQYEVERLAARIGELNDQILEETRGRGDEIERVYQAITQRPPPSGRGRGSRPEDLTKP